MKHEDKMIFLRKLLEFKAETTDIEWFPESKLKVI